MAHRVRDATVSGKDASELRKCVSRAAAMLGDGGRLRKASSGLPPEARGYYPEYKPPEKQQSGIGIRRGLKIAGGVLGLLAGSRATRSKELSRLLRRTARVGGAAVGIKVGSDVGNRFKPRRRASDEFPALVAKADAPRVLTTAREIVRIASAS